MSVTPETTVGQLAAERLGRIRVFESFGIDYCCGGQATLVEAARQAGCDVEAVMAKLAAHDEEAVDHPRERVDWREQTLTALTDHVVATHHEFMKSTLPELGALMAKVLNAHGPNHPELAEVAQVYGDLRAEIEDHLGKEEQILFPLIQKMESTRTAGNAHCGTVNNPIRVMEHEHDNAGEALRRLRELTGGYAVPGDACPTYQALMAGLAAMERDLHEHIHKENNILHPRATALEASLLAAAQGES
ncbi:MAG: iron-sulfur cluster repair di-iron protein [bacterium]|nr:iron-sulfur cluster repair di-iron protein [bacterium]